MWAQNDLLGLYYAIHQAPYGSGLAWPAEELKRVGVGFEQLSAALEQLKFVLLLTDESADRAATSVYVFFEPLADVVVALSHAERKISVVPEMWHSTELGFRGLIDQAEALLEHGETMEAVSIFLRELPKIIAQG